MALQNAKFQYRHTAASGDLSNFPDRLACLWIYPTVENSIVNYKNEELCYVGLLYSW